MDMKKIFALCCMVAAGFASVSCEKTDDGYTGTNYIYLTSGTNSMYDTENDAIDVTVQLTASLKEDLTLTLAVADDEDGIITLEGNPVTIAAGAKTGTVKVRTKELNVMEKNFRVTLDKEATVLPGKVAWKEDFTFTVYTSSVPDLSDAQKTIVEAYKEKTGIDLTKYLGLVDVTTVYTASNPDTDVLDDMTITGKTKIMLSDESTEDQPVLKMTINPMGITDALYSKLKEQTLNSPYWTDEDASADYRTLLDVIGWTNESVESFSASLDGIILGEDKSVEFAATRNVIDEYGDEVEQFKVHFEYEFSAFDREQAAIEANKVGIGFNEDWYGEATVSPGFWLNYDDLSEDYFGEEDEDGNFIPSATFVEPSAAISEDEMKFIFSMYHRNDNNYTKVVATYTPNK